MKKSTIAKLCIAFLAIATGWFALPLPYGRAAQGATSPEITLTIFGAGTLAVPFRQIDDAFMKQHPNVTIQPQFGGSVKMVKQVTELGQIADVVAVADYSVIPKYLFEGGTKYTDLVRGIRNKRNHFRLHRRKQIRRRDHRTELVPGVVSSGRPDWTLES